MGYARCAGKIPSLRGVGRIDANRSGYPLAFAGVLPHPSGTMAIRRPPGFDTIDINQFGNFRLPWKLILAAVLGLAALGMVGSCVFTVEPAEVAVILRFGKYVRDANPGLHFKLPSPVEQVAKVQVERQHKQEFGFRTLDAGVRSRYSRDNFDAESLMLTGDLNVAVVEWTTQYRITEPYKYLFRVRNVEQTFRDLNEAVMRTVVGDRSVNEVLTVGRQEIQEDVERRLQELCDQYETGIKVEQIVLQDVEPPESVKPSFNEVNQAEQERERAINEARADYNKAVPRARGEALQMIQQAEGYAVDRTNRAIGDAALFEQMLAAYARAQDVTRRRLYLETMEDVFPSVQKKILLDEDIRGLLPVLPLGAEGGATVSPPPMVPPTQAPARTQPKGVTR